MTLLSTSKNVLVVGGASGIGLATVKAFIEQKANVAVLDVNEAALAELTQKYNHNQIIVRQGDVRKQADIEAIVKQMIERWQQLDILVYSAGIFPDQLLVEMTEEQWDTVLDINTKGAFLTCQTVAKQMIAQGNGGHIVTISSGSYRSARVGSGHYCASKAGLVMLTQVLAQELAAHHIYVNSIAPGLIDNPILDATYKQEFVKRIPLGRIGEGADIASAILMITSPYNTYMTGQTIAVDGGLSAGQYGLPLSNKVDN